MNRHLRLFGPPVLVDGDGQPLSFRTKKQLALLVYLVLETRQRPAPRDLLLEFFWPAVEPQRGRHSLSQALTSIRARLGPDAVTRDRHTVQLLREVTTDLDDLGRANPGSVAVQHPLEELDRAGSADFGHWVDGVRQRCLREVRGVLARQMDEARTRGDVNRVYERAAQLYRVDPLSSAAIHALAEQLLQESDTAGTCRLIRSYCTRFESEVGGQAPPDLLRLLRRIEAGTIRPPSGLPVEATRRLARAEVFVGREAELARLEALWNEASRGELVTCLVAGPVGIGKSSLLRRFAMSVSARGGTALEVACQEIGRTIPFAAVSDLIQVLSRDPAVSGTDPRWLAEASRVSPGLRAAYPGIPEAPPVPAESVRFRLAESLVRIIEAVCESKPTLLTIDDVQNLDAASRDVLFVALRRMHSTPTMIGASSIAFNAANQVNHEPDQIPDFGWDDSILMTPLDEEGAHAIIDMLSVGFQPLTNSTTEVLVRLASGNPHLVERLLTDWQHNKSRSLIAAHCQGATGTSDAAPPVMIKRMMRRHCAGLTHNAGQMANLLAVARRKLSIHELRQLLGLSASDSDHAALQLLERGLARISEGGLTLRNELERDYIYRSIDIDRRRFHHSQIGALLTEADAQDDFQLWLEVCYHFRRAGLVDKAAMALFRGVASAVDGGAANEAEEAIRALLPDKPKRHYNTLQLLLARCCAIQGKYRDTQEALRDIDLTHLCPEDRVEASILLAEAFHRGRLADDDTIRTRVHNAFNLAIEIGSEKEQLRILQTKAELASEAGDLNGLTVVARAAGQIRREASDREVAVHASLSIAYGQLMSGELSAAAREFDSCVLSLRGCGLQDLLRRALNGKAICQLSYGHFDATVDSLCESTAIAEQLGDCDAAANAWSNLGSVYEDLGKFALAADCYIRAATRAVSTSNPRRLAEIAINAAGLALSLGLEQQAQLLAAAADIYANRTMQWRLMVDVYNLKADLELAYGNQDAAWTYVNRAEAVRGDRSYLLADMGRHERLRHHQEWGMASDHQLRSRWRSTEELARRCPQLADQLEVRLFEEWALRGRSTATPSNCAVLRQTIERGLYGVMSRLDALNVGVANIGERRTSEASARRVVRAHRYCDSADVETSISKCLSLAELLRYDKTHLPNVDQTAYPSTGATQ